MIKWQLILEKNSPLRDELNLNFEACHGDNDLVKAECSFDKAIETSVQGEYNQQRTALYFPKNQIKAVFFDMDSTVIKQECIVELARATNTSDKVLEITERAMAGELDFNEAFIERVSLLEGAPASVIREVISSLELHDGIREFSEFANESKIELYLVSGGFIPMAKAISAKLNFADYHSNPLETVNDKITGKVSYPIVNGEAKKSFVLDKLRQRGWDRTNIMVVGDGANDLAMMGVSQIAVGFQAKKSLYPHINGLNLKSHLSLIDIVKT